MSGGRDAFHFAYGSPRLGFASPVIVLGATKPSAALAERESGTWMHDLLALWKDADTDIPVLIAAKSVFFERPALLRRISLSTFNRL
jgi:hypothetical protein